MELDDVTHTEDEQPVVSVKHERLPWVLLFVVVGVSIATTCLLVYKASSETDRANTAYAEKTAATARALQSENLAEGLKTRVSDLETDVRRISEERDSAQKQLRAVPKVAEPAATPTAAKKTAPPPKKTVKKKKK